MYDVAKTRSKYVFGTSIESFEEKEDAIEVRITNGTTDLFDLLVGSDGQGFRIHRMILGDGAPDAFKPLGGGIPEQKEALREPLALRFPSSL
jgi:hypothetical protein